CYIQRKKVFAEEIKIRPAKKGDQVIFRLDVTAWNDGRKISLIGLKKVISNHRSVGSPSFVLSILLLITDQQGEINVLSEIGRIIQGILPVPTVQRPIKVGGRSSRTKTVTVNGGIKCVVFQCQPVDPVSGS